MAIQVLLLFGGESSEHEVSLISARNVYEALDKEKYDVRLGRIARDGREWLLVNSFDDTSGVEMFPMLGQRKFWTENGEVSVDVIFPVLHGAHGEDGDVQGLAQLLHIPCVGPSLIGAAVTMDKDVTKRLLRDSGIPVVDWVTWHISEDRPEYSDVASRLGGTVFVKPANAGSSVGVSKVRNEQEFTKALDFAAEHDDFILIEKAVNGKEMQIAVLGNEKPEHTEICEIIIGADFHDFEDKYSESSAAEFHVPARVSDKITKQIKDYAVKAYLATRCQGMARVDFFLSDSDEIFLNEINSIPGFTSVSIYPRLWREAGTDATGLVDSLVSLALEVNDYV